MKLKNSERTVEKSVYSGAAPKLLICWLDAPTGKKTTRSCMVVPEAD